MHTENTNFSCWFFFITVGGIKSSIPDCMSKALLEVGVVSSRLFLDLLVLVVKPQNLLMSMPLKNDKSQSSMRQPVLSLS